MCTRRGTWDYEGHVLCGACVKRLAAVLAAHDERPRLDVLYGNGFITPQWIAMEAMDVLTNKLATTQQFNRDYDVKFGDTIRVRLPQRFKP